MYCTYVKHFFKILSYEKDKAHVTKVSKFNQMLSKSFCSPIPIYFVDRRKHKKRNVKDKKEILLHVLVRYYTEYRTQPISCKNF